MSGGVTSLIDPFAQAIIAILFLSVLGLPPIAFEHSRATHLHFARPALIRQHLAIGINQSIATNESWSWRVQTTR